MGNFFASISVHVSSCIEFKPTSNQNPYANRGTNMERYIYVKSMPKESYRTFLIYQSKQAKFNGARHLSIVLF